MEKRDFLYRCAIWYNGDEVMYIVDHVEKIVFLVYEKDMLIYDKAFDSAVILTTYEGEKEIAAYKELKEYEWQDTKVSYEEWKDLVYNEDGYIKTGYREVCADDLNKMRKEITWDIAEKLEKIDENWDILNEGKTVEEMFNELRKVGKAWTIHPYC